MKIDFFSSVKISAIMATQQTDKKHPFSQMEMVILASTPPVTWIQKQIASHFPLEIASLVTAFGHCHPDDLSPYNPACLVCEPDRAVAIALAPKLCSNVGCHNPVDAKALPWDVHEEDDQVQKDACNYCVVRTARMRRRAKIKRGKFKLGKFRLAKNGLGQKTEAGKCAVYNCGRRFWQLSRNHYPVCHRHMDGVFPFRGQIQVTHECDHSRRKLTLTLDDWKAQAALPDSDNEN